MRYFLRKNEKVLQNTKRLDPWVICKKCLCTQNYVNIECKPIMELLYMYVITSLVGVVCGLQGDRKKNKSPTSLLGRE